MRYKFSITFILVYVLLSCNNSHDNNQTNTISLLADKDSCYNLYRSIKSKPAEASRKIEILENTFTDTVLLGYAVLPPGYTGSFTYLRINNEVLYYSVNKDTEDSLPKTTTLCINLYQKRSVTGKIVVEYH